MPGVSREDIIAAYRAILGRDPESEAAIAAHAGHASAAQLLTTLAASEEARSRLGGRTGASARRINSFVYEASAAAGIAMPDIPVFFVEHFGQCAEDVIVSALLVAWARNHGRNLASATYLEIGGNHPIATSATYLLHRRHRMRGVLVEANPDLIGPLRAVRSGDLVLHGAVQTEDVEEVTLSISNLSELSSLDRSFVQGWAGGSVGERRLAQVPALRIGRIIRDHLEDRAPHFLSLDIEGLDLPVLADLDFARHRPVVIQIEPSEHHLPGNTAAMIDFLRARGYGLVAETPVNLVFLDTEALGPVPEAGGRPSD